jgi:hypothetical protein
MTGAEVSKFLSLTKASSQCSIHSKTISFVRRLHNGLDMKLKYLMNLLYKPTCPKNDLTSLTDFGVGKLSINSILDLSTSIHVDETM